MKRNLLPISICASLLFVTGCGAKQPAPINKHDEDSSKTDTNVVVETSYLSIQSKDTVLTIGETEIWVLSPDGEIKADILMLPGWNFKKEKVCKESSFCDRALAEGYRLILPEMMKSVYASKYYPETRKDYRSFLTLTWVTDTMIPTLQETYGIFSGKNNYLHGISTGARGAALVHLNTDELFSKVVLLSGDYNNAEIPNDNLLRNTYGPFSKFKDRWIENDNPWKQSVNWKASLYIAHGMIDETVPVEQSLRFAEHVAINHTDCKVIQNFPEAAGHDFNFWDGETEAILKFFRD